VSWLREFQEDVAKVALNYDLRPGDTVEIDCEYVDGYDPTFTDGPNYNYFSVGIRNSAGIYVVCTDILKEEMKTFWLNLMAKAQERN
jgi:hypothetical protein